CQGESISIGGNTYNVSGIYLDTLTNMWGCDSIITTNLTVHPLPVISLSTNSPVCSGMSLNLTASGGSQYIWTGPNSYYSTHQNPVINNVLPAYTGIFELKAVTAFGCRDSATTQVTIHPRPHLQRGNIVPASCFLPNGSASVSATGGTMPYSYNWNPSTGQNTGNVTGVPGGDYTVYVLDLNGCTDSIDLTVPDLPPPLVSFTSTPEPGDTLFENTQIQFQNGSSGAVAYLWTFGDGNQSNQTDPYHLFPETGTYTVTLTGYDLHQDCPQSFSATYIILPPGALYIPNAFTPNGDGANDFFLMKGEGVADLSCMLYDRWGKEIYLIQSLNEKWDGKVRGKDAPEGVYTYKLNAVFLDGRSMERSGTVTLIR
ncbi:MAG: gliding motility-associated C-terminal domain-containing protein, partial [Bacteroidia bacterium]|nr:gliding motility-associated C-terminal domain-containing protein [Bacteroidia bacterium]